ncbi:cytochrome c oxidase assembly protein [Pararhodobacter sp. SW119]|uniref:cytochrome c oxidase assembly protein n=1 Tax=Pararhodobacter sp. SW119 TaxID=2780075 RepID=UPI001ADF8A0A|nr:cytochrome c oxidase assembly protein [Pararhodobacter sp. SW119]
MNGTLPYCGPAPASSDWYWAWNADPYLIGALVALTIWGLLAVSEADPGQRRAVQFAAVAATVAFVSPLCAMTAALFSARTLHHLVVLGVLAPAIALAFPVRRLPIALPFLAMSAALWLWHLPAAYSAAWDHAGVYWAMQAALILPAWAFWSAILHRPGLGHALWLLPVVGQMGLLGALLTFAPTPFYLEHLAHAERFGLSALADQQLAGLIMWVPGMAPLAALAAMMAWRALRDEATA